MKNLYIYDLKNVFRNNKRIYYIYLGIVLLFCLVIIRQCNSYKDIGLMVDKPTSADLFLHFVVGRYDFYPGLGEPFEIPSLWLMVQILCDFIIGRYVNSDLSGIGSQLIIRTRRKSQWLLGKILFCFGVCLSLYGMLLGTIVLFGLVVKMPISFQTTQDFCVLMNNMNEGPAELMTANLFLIYALILPVCTLFIISVVQMIISIKFNSIISFVAIVIYQICSVYFRHPLLIGRYSMILRSKLCTEDGFGILEALIVETITSFIAVIVGVFVLNHTDFIKDSQK